MTKTIPEAVRLFLRKHYLSIAKRVTPPKGTTRRDNASLILQNQFPRYFKGMQLEEVDDILHMPSEETVKKMISDLICKRCGHGDNLVVSVKGSDDNGIPMSGYDIYCTTPDRESTVYTKCWYHLGRSEKYE